MKIHVAFTVDLSPEDRRRLSAYAREIGLDHDGPGERVLLRRLLVEHGRAALDDAAECGQFGEGGTP